jgi:nucleoside-diphosphate-sugar epimerase
MARRRSIAILGATSRMARDFIAQFSEPEALHLFARNGQGRPYAEFSAGTYDTLINFVGVGDPSRTREMGHDILSVTRQYDEMALEYQARHPGTRYVFLSSGAAYGGEFMVPARDGGETPLSPDLPQNYYGLAKQEAEGRHRALPGHTIFDLRIFNYVCRTMDLSAKFLLAEMVRCIHHRTVFRTADRAMTRDFLHPADFRQLVECCFAADGNMAVDCYSRSPITKDELLTLMATHFDLRYEIVKEAATINITGEKPDYRSESRRAADLGYAPVYSSESAIVTEVGAILSGN